MGVLGKSAVVPAAEVVRWVFLFLKLCCLVIGDFEAFCCFQCERSCCSSREFAFY